MPLVRIAANPILGILAIRAMVVQELIYKFYPRRLDIHQEKSHSQKKKDSLC